jgi:hypothetical protein
MGYILDISPPPQHTILRDRVYYFQLPVPKQHQLGIQCMIISTGLSDEKSGH